MVGNFQKKGLFNDSAHTQTRTRTRTHTHTHTHTHTITVGISVAKLKKCHGEIIVSVCLSELKTAFPVKLRNPCSSVRRKEPEAVFSRGHCSIISSRFLLHPCSDYLRTERNKSISQVMKRMLQQTNFFL